MSDQLLRSRLRLCALPCKAQSVKLVLLPMNEVQLGRKGLKGPCPLGFRIKERICRVSQLGHRMTVALRRGARICCLVHRNAICIN